MSHARQHAWERIPAAQAAEIVAYEKGLDRTWQWFVDNDNQHAHDPQTGDVETFQRTGDPVCNLRRVRRHDAWDYERKVWPVAKA